MNAWIPSHYIGSKIIFLWAESPFYPGSEREVGPIDLPLQRNPLTNIPHVRASSLKGALRSFFEYFLQDNSNKTKIIEAIFGSQDIAANYIFTDAEILLFPVRSDLYSFIYLISKSQIALLNQALSYLNIKNYSFLHDLERLESNENLISTDSSLPEGEITILDGEIDITNIRKDGRIKQLADFLIRYALPRDPKNKNELLPGYNYLRNKIQRNLIFISNDSSFPDILERGLIRTVRIAIDYAIKVTKPGALFYQELIPQYTLLFSTMFQSSRFTRSGSNIDAFEKSLQNGILLNLGGDESTGKGIIRVFLSTIKD